MDTAITLLAILVFVGGFLLFAAVRNARRRRAEEAWREAMTTDPGGAGASDANGGMPLDLGAMLEDLTKASVSWSSRSFAWDQDKGEWVEVASEDSQPAIPPRADRPATERPRAAGPASATIVRETLTQTQVTSVATA